MNPLATIAEERRGDTAVARVNGEIDASNTLWLGTRLRALVSNHSDGLVVDLSETTYLDSAGIALFFDLGAELRRHLLHLQLVMPEGSPIARMAALTGLDSVVPVHARLDEALPAV